MPTIQCWPSPGRVELETLVGQLAEFESSRVDSGSNLWVLTRVKIELAKNGCGCAAEKAVLLDQTLKWAQSNMRWLKIVGAY
jgi:hypothetical protein